MTVGSAVYVDIATSIVGMDPWLQSQFLTGIKTSKGDGLRRFVCNYSTIFANCYNIHLSDVRLVKFEVDRPCVVYLCWDSKSALPLLFLFQTNIVS